MIASLFVGRTFDRQIQGETQELKALISYTRNRIIEDIHNEVQPQTEAPRVVRAIRGDNSHPAGMAESVLEILEYGDDNGLIRANKGDSDLRRGMKDLEALNRARQAPPQATIRLRTPEKRATIEVTLPIQPRNKFVGFVTGGYFLREHLEQVLKDQSRHPIFLREGDRPVPLNAAGDKIPEAEREALLPISSSAVDGFQKMPLDGVPHNIGLISILEGDTDTQVALIIAYSNQNEIELRNQLMLALLATGGVGLVFVYIVSYIIGLRMTKPINQLAAGATEIAAGNLDHRVVVQSRDEIGGLAYAFNQMAVDLKVNLEKRLSAERVAAWRDVARRISHEIKNPLFPIRLSVENLQRAYRSQPEIFDEIFDKCTETVVEEVGSLQRMVDEFHQFARMPAPRRKPSDLNHILETVLTLYAESAVQIKIEANLEPNLPWLDLDSEQISQALGNLIRNAVEAMSDGGNLSVSTQLVGDKVVIEIQDTGAGMSPDKQEKIFTPYYTTKEKGTGLGMAIVQRIIADHDGKISVESAVAVGTTVRIELPVRI